MGISGGNPPWCRQFSPPLRCRHHRIRVFSNLLSLELGSDQFHTGFRDDGYEPAPKVSPVAVPAETPMSRITADRQRNLPASEPKSVELTIVGTRSSWEPPQRKDD